MLNLLRVGLNRSVSLADNRRTIDIPASMSWIPGDPFGYLTIQGLVTEMAGDFIFRHSLGDVFKRRWVCFYLGFLPEFGDAFAIYGLKHLLPVVIRIRYIGHWLSIS